MFSIHSTLFCCLSTRGLDISHPSLRLLYIFVDPGLLCGVPICFWFYLTFSKRKVIIWYAEYCIALHCIVLCSGVKTKESYWIFHFRILLVSSKRFRKHIRSYTIFFVYWARDFQFWPLAYFVIFCNCTKIQQDKTNLISDILYLLN